MKNIIMNTNVEKEDMYIYKTSIKKCIEKKEKVIIDFNKNILPSTYYCTLFIELMDLYGRNIVNQYIECRNIGNKEEFNRVFYGTSILK